MRCIKERVGFSAYENLHLSVLPFVRSLVRLFARPSVHPVDPEYALVMQLGFGKGKEGRGKIGEIVHTSVSK